MTRPIGNIMIAATAVILIAIGKTDPIVFMRGHLQRLFFPENKVIYSSSAKLNSFRSTILQIKELVRENNQLRQENEKLTAATAQMSELKNRLEILEKELNLKPSAKDQKYIAAAVVGRSPSNYRGSITIDRGEEDGIKKNLPIVSSGFLVGRVAEVFPRSAIVELITSHRFMTPVVLQDSRILGLLRGGIKGIQVEQLPIDGEIKIGEMVVTSGLAGELPAGIPVGTVKTITSKPSDIFQSVLLENSVNISQTELVLVIL